MTAATLRMDFSWTPEQDEHYARTLRFAREKLTDGDGEQPHVFPTEMWRAAAQFGLAGLCVSPEYGGGGLDGLATARALEAVGNGCRDGGLGFALAAHLFACCVPIDAYGSEAQKARYLPQLCAGSWVGANAITEDNAGSDAFALQTRAVSDGDSYVLDGEKTFVTNAPLAHVFVVYASTNPRHGVLGTTAFLVDRDAPGVTVGAPMVKVGLTTAQMARVRFDNCRIGADHRLAAEGAGAAVFKHSMGWERSCLFALWVGAMDRQLAEVIQRVTTRSQFGRPIGSNQAISHRVVEMKLRLEAARLLLYRACWERTQGVASDLTTSLAKLAISEAFVQSSVDAVQIFGAAGVVRDNGVERYVRDALPGTIYSGTSEMQRELVARALGLPPPR